MSNKHRRKDVSKRVFLSRFEKDSTFGELGDFLRKYSPYRLEVLKRPILAGRPLKFYELYGGDSYEKSRLKKHIPTMSKAKLLSMEKVNGINLISLAFNGLMVYLSSLNGLLNDFLDRESEELTSIFKQEWREGELRLVDRIRSVFEGERSRIRYRKHKEVLDVLEPFWYHSLE